MLLSSRHVFLSLSPTINLWLSFKVPLYVSYRHVFNTPNTFWADLFKGKCLEWFSFTSCRVASASFALSRSHLCVLDWVGKRTRVSIKAAAQGEEQTEPQVKAVGLREAQLTAIESTKPLLFLSVTTHTIETKSPLLHYHIIYPLHVFVFGMSLQRIIILRSEHAVIWAHSSKQKSDTRRMKTCMVALIIRWCSTSEHTLGVEKTRGRVMKRKEGDKPEKHRMKQWMCSKSVVLLRESQWKSVSKQWKSGQGSEGRSGLDSTEKPGSHCWI